MMVKRAVLLLMVLLAAGLAISGTMAWFEDSAGSSMNAFKAGSMGILASDDLHEMHVPVVNNTWMMENMQPCVTVSGDDSSCDSNSYTYNMIAYENDGSIYGDHVELSFSYSGDTGLAPYIHIITMGYDGVNIKKVLSDTNGNGYKDLADLTSMGNAFILDDLPAPTSGVQVLSMELGFSATAGNDMMGKSMIMTATATLNQHESQ